jgi:hypothetical protein
MLREEMVSHSQERDPKEKVPEEKLVAQIGVPGGSQFF